MGVCAPELGAAPVRLAIQVIPDVLRFGGPVQMVLDRRWRLYNVNNLKLARYKEIFPAPANPDIS